jgi:methylated-DNA-protein-cysteine methyltransferase-like protein
MHTPIHQLMTRQSFTDRIIVLIHRIPAGRVATYGQIAAMAGNPKAARQVARVLHSCSEKEKLPWHRVVNREGCIVVNPRPAREEQKRLLQCEGIELDEGEAVDLARFLWRPERIR